MSRISRRGTILSYRSARTSRSATVFLILPGLVDCEIFFSSVRRYRLSPLPLQEQAVQHRPQFRRQVRVDHACELSPSLVQPNPDQVGQPSRAGKLYPFLDQEVGAAPEDEPWLEVDTSHLPDLRDQPAFSLLVERPEALQVENAALMVKAGPLPVALGGKRVGSVPGHPGDEGDVAFMISFCGEEAPRRPEIAVCQQEPDPARRAAQAMRRIQDGSREVEEPLAFDAAEDRRAVALGLFGRIQDAHSGHEGIRCRELRRKRSFSQCVPYNECR